MSQKPFKILGISSGRSMGNAEVMLRECLMACEKIAPADIRIIRLRTLKIQYCDGCMECMKDAAGGGNGECPIKDDFTWLKEQVLWADAIIFADPSFVYMPTAEVITMMNRCLGIGRDFEAKCRANPKVVGLICVGGSDTVDFTLPMQSAALERLCRGYILADQFYANWIRGKGYIAAQPYHLERARLQAKRVMNKLMGLPIPAISTRIRKLNPMEYTDDVYTDLYDCPVCHSAVVTMGKTVPENGKFTCVICGATGRIVSHGGKLTYEWDDDTVAHNRMSLEGDEANIEAFKKAQAPKSGDKAKVGSYPYLTPSKEVEKKKSRIIAVVAGTAGGASELLARKALDEATRDGKYEGVIVRILDLNIRFCTGCLMCQGGARFRGGSGECVLKDDDFWLLDQLAECDGVIIALDSIAWYTYSEAIAFLQRFGHGMKRRIRNSTLPPRPYAVMISSYDNEVVNATYAAVQMSAMSVANGGPYIAREFFPNVPLLGDGILYDADAVTRAGKAGKAVVRATGHVQRDEIKLIDKFDGLCPACGLTFIELHPDMTFSCAHCDAQGRFERKFGENVLIWDQYSVEHSRRTPYGGALHFKHIGYSQYDDHIVQTNPKVTEELLAPYVAYGKLIKPGK